MIIQLELHTERQEMAFDTTEIKVMGVVFDLSLRHSKNDKKHIDNVKYSLIEFIRANFDDDDIMYLYHQDSFVPANRVGAQVASIANYKTQGWKLDVSSALRDTLFIIGCEPYDEKVILLVTDRLSDTKVLKRIVALNDKDMLGCKLICIDIGCHLPNVDYAKIVHVSDSDQLTDLKEVIYGESNICSADRRAE